MFTSVVCATSGNPPLRRDEKIARKYCFRATTTIARKNSDRPYAVVFGYDTKPLIATEVRQVAQEFCTTNADAFEADDDVELVIFEECPMELTDEIFFQMFVEDTDEDEKDVAHT